MARRGFSSDRESRLDKVADNAGLWYNRTEKKYNNKHKMRKTVLLASALCAGVVFAAGAKSSEPFRAGERITFQDLTTHPSGAVTTSAAGFYHVSQSLTLTAGDTLVVDANLQQVPA